MANGRNEGRNEAVIVSTARTPLCKSWRGALNLTHGAKMGGHVVHAALERAKERPDMVYSKFADRICEKGWFGQKAGRGWYRYEKGNRKPIPDPEVEKLLEEYRNEIHVKPRKISDDEIVERCIFALANEGARILEEGIALRASDIDMVYLTGYGYPPYRGGPMFYADQVGLDKVLDSITRYKAGYQGSQWQPAPGLVKFAKEGRRFNG